MILRAITLLSLGFNPCVVKWILLSQVTNRDDLVYHIGGDEHGILRPSGGLKVGNLVKLIPGHCDPTVNLYDHVVCIREGLVENVWTINGRGPGV